LHSEKELERLLETHLIPSDAIDYLLTDNIKGFKNARKKAIHKEIKRLTKMKPRM